MDDKTLPEGLENISFEVTRTPCYLCGAISDFCTALYLFSWTVIYYEAQCCCLQGHSAMYSRLCSKGQILQFYSGMRSIRWMDEMQELNMDGLGWVGIDLLTAGW